VVPESLLSRKGLKRDSRIKRHSDLVKEQIGGEDASPAAAWTHRIFAAKKENPFCRAQCENVF
jgi:hypothetical protein